MPGQNVHQVCVCCWSTRGQPNNDELLWITQKWSVQRMLLSNLVDSPCWDCCSVCAGSLFYLHRLIPTDLGSSKKCLLQLMPAFATTERKRQKQGRFPDRHVIFIKQTKIPCTVLCHSENPACCCWISHRLLTRYHGVLFFFSVQEVLRGTERSVCLGNM